MKDPRRVQDELEDAKDERNLLYAQRRKKLEFYYQPFEERIRHYEFLAKLPPQDRECVTPIIGPAGSGKTRLILDYLKRHPPQWNNGNYSIPAIHISMTHFTRVEDFSPALLAALEVPDAYPQPNQKDRHTHMERMNRFYRLAPSLGLRLVFLDEFHDCAKVDGRGEPFLRLLKGMILQGVRVIPAGTNALVRLLERDDQFKSRFDFSAGYMPMIRHPRLVKACMEHISGFPSQDISDAAVEFVLKATDGRIGFILELTEKTLRQYNALDLKSLTRKAKDTQLIK